MGACSFNPEPLAMRDATHMCNNRALAQTTTGAWCDLEALWAWTGLPCWSMGRYCARRSSMSWRWRVCKQEQSENDRGSKWEAWWAMHGGPGMADEQSTQSTCGQAANTKTASNLPARHGDEHDHTDHADHQNDDQDHGPHGHALGSLDGLTRRAAFDLLNA